MYVCRMQKGWGLFIQTSFDLVPYTNILDIMIPPSCYVTHTLELCNRYNMCPKYIILIRF